VTEIRLTSLELALVAKFNSEMAACYDEVAEDAGTRAETRDAARDSASRRRERARLFELEARRLGAYPTEPCEELTQMPPARYAGPERRTDERRVRERRDRRPSSSAPQGRSERRVNRERRRGQRRRG
jgi:hypothetical protein